jgi:hypothetical protein
MFKITSSPNFKTLNFHGIQLQVPERATHVCVDNSGLLKSFMCLSGDEPYVFQDVCWGVDIMAGNVLLCQHGIVEFEGDWRESMIKLYHLPGKPK